MSIGFEEILGLVFFIFFVVVPLFTKKGKPPAAGAPPRAPGVPQPGAPRPGGAPPQAGPVVADAQPPEAPGSWRELMQEVQRRVAEADAREKAAASRGATGGAAVPSSMPAAPASGALVPERTSGGLVRGGTSGGASRPGTLVATDPFGGGLVTSRPSAGLGREGATAPLAEAAPLQVTRVRTNSRKAVDAAEAAVAARRAQAAQAARLGAPPAAHAYLATGRDDLVRGMIWHEILSEPAALKRLRRTRSPHR